MGKLVKIFGIVTLFRQLFGRRRVAGRRTF